MRFISVTILTITLAVAAVHAGASDAEPHREQRIVRKREMPRLKFNRRAFPDAGNTKTKDQIEKEEIDKVITEFTKLLVAQGAANGQSQLTAASNNQVFPAVSAPPPPPPPAIQALINNAGGAYAPSPATFPSGACGSAACSGGFSAPQVAPYNAYAAPASPYFASVAANKPTGTSLPKSEKSEEEGQEGQSGEEKDQEEEKDQDEDKDEDKEQEEKDKKEEDKDKDEDKDQEEDKDTDDEGNKNLEKRIEKRQDINAGVSAQEADESESPDSGEDEA